MEDEAAHLRTDIDRYRKLLNLIADQRAIEAVELMIAEKEKRLRAIMEPSH